MTTTPVGMRCPECSRQKTKVRTAATLTGTPQLTYALIAINAIAYVLTSGGSTGPSGELYSKGVLFGPLVADGEWWRIISSGFLHAGILHIVLNMVFLWFLGTMLEPAIGKIRFAIIYLVSLVGGSFGALLLTPNDSTVGASGAVFGLMGAAILFMRTRGDRRHAVRPRTDADPEPRADVPSRGSPSAATSAGCSPAACSATSCSRSRSAARSRATSSTACRPR